MKAVYSLQGKKRRNYTYQCECGEQLEGRWDAFAHLVYQHGNSEQIANRTILEAQRQAVGAGR